MKREGGGAEQVLAMLKGGGGAQQVWGSFYAVAWVSAILKGAL